MLSVVVLSEKGSQKRVPGKGFPDTQQVLSKIPERVFPERVSDKYTRKGFPDPEHMINMN